MTGSSRSLLLALGAVAACAAKTITPGAPPPPALVETRSAPPATPARACGEPSGVPVTPGAGPLPGRLCGRLQIAGGHAVPATPGTLVLAWFRPDELARFRQGRFPPIGLLGAFIERARVVPEARLAPGAGLAYAIDYPGGDAAVLAIGDFRQAFWPTLFGSGGEGNLIGVSPGTPEGPSSSRADVQLEIVPPRPPAPERCQGERLELVRVEAPEVAGTVGNETARRLCVWLPPSYATSPRRRYPVVYLLPGYGGRDTSYLVGNQELRSTVEALAREGVGEAILVGVDTGTRHGATYFTDSEAGGAWARFARARLVPEIDRRYRTRAAAAGRALVGHSTGGFNAVSLAVRFSDLFGAVGASAPDALDFEDWLLGGDGRVRTKWLAWTRLEAAVGGEGQMVSYAAAWTAHPPAPRVSFPYELDTGALRPVEWQAWRAQSPLRLLDDPTRLADVRRRLAGRLFITVGKHDEFGLFEPARRFAARLDELAIAHEFHASEGGHGSDQRAGLRSALAFVLRKMSPKGP